ncbi:hypothetical protein [Streptomyces sp. NBC_00859]|uniref:hypothetical protein n=1 Tax=Streptomyces sp. NBC_00859 TaxID=2903682 RepID=UPI00386FC96D|nr:hypothetical protein OG584_01965 [Streptomyces sp. NBC_00859]
MPHYRDNRQTQPPHHMLMTVVGETYVVYAPTAFSDRWTEQRGSTQRVDGTKLHLLLGPAIAAVWITVTVVLFV